MELMSGGERSKLKHLELDLQMLADTTQKLAQDCKGDSLALLALLRTLENLHREIRESLFQESLPDNRQALYHLLRDIEATGGWPYIHRLRLQSLLINLQPQENDDVTTSLPLFSQSSPTQIPDPKDGEGNRC